MKLFHCGCIFLLSSFSINAQTNSTADSLNKHIQKEGFSNEQKESEFPGGIAGWAAFLKANLKYPAKAQRKKIEGTVTVEFIVNTDGTLSDIKALNGPELLLGAAVDVIKKSPNWNVAIQNGRKVRSYKKQPVTFKLG